MGLADATAQPVGASVMAGEAQVLSSGATTVVNQSTSKAIINWQDFSVGQGASVQFNQPNSASVTLNRVTGSGLSTIDGAIRANGQVWLLNPNGVLFGNGARINVGGLLATTSDIANQDFLEGRYNFSSGGNGEIVNNGQIRAHGGGSVILSAPRVTNRGLISANAGHVVLGGTDTFTVDFNGDHLLSYVIGASTQTGAVTNSGEIEAQGGQILMTARAAAGVQDAVINNTGMAEATSAREVNGEIILDAGEGTATNAGTLDASGKAAGQTGGTVKILGRLAAVADNAMIEVSGDAGGGTALIGGNFQGRGAEMHAQATRIGKATINADAITSGNGGKVVAWSDGRTDFAGSITARGGAAGGDGGRVETSGHDLNVPGSAFVSTFAPLGKAGSWLLDPHNITITTSCTPACAPVTGQTFSNSPQIDVSIDPNAIATTLQGGTSVTLQAATDIIFQNSLISAVGTPGATLTLQAGRTISLGASTINLPLDNLVMIANDPGGAATGFRDAGLATISSTGGTITAARLDLVLLSNGADGSSIGTNAAPLLVAGGTSTYIKTQNASAWLTAGAGGTSNFVIGNSANSLGADLGTGNLTLVSNGAQQQAPISVNNFTINLPSGLSSGNPVTLTNTGNAITGFVNINAMGRDSQGAPYVQLTNSGALTLAAINTIPNTSGDTGPAGAAKFITTSGDINLTGVISVTGLTLSAAGKITEIGTPSRITSAAVQNDTQAGSAGVTLIAGGDISLPNSNTIAQNTAATGNGNQTTVVTPGRLSVNISGTGNATLNFVSNLRLLQSTLANGALSLTTSGSYTLLNASGGTVTSSNGIQIYAPLSATGLLTLSAAGDITQNTSASLDVHITSATGLSATSSGGNIVLDDFGHTGQPVDVGNKVSGYVRFSTPGFFTFYNTVKTVVGALPGAAGAGITSVTGGTIQVFDTVGLTAHNDLVLNSPITTSNTLSLGATGNIINYQAHAPLSAPSISLFTSFGSIGALDGISPAPVPMVLAPRVAANTLVFMAQAPNGDVNLSITGSGQIGFGSGINPGLRGNNVLVNLNGNGATGTSLVQTSGTVGQIQANNVNFSILNATSSAITLNNPANAIGAASLTANVINLLNTGPLLLLSAKNSGANNTVAASAVTVQTSGNLTLGDSNSAPPVIATGQVFLRSTGGAILASPRTGVTSDIVAGTVGLAADGGTIGLSTAPVVIAANNLAARTINGDINIGAAVLNSLPLNITSVVGPGITLNGINAGTGNVALLGGAQLTINAGTIVGNNLKLSGAGVTVTNAQISSLTANVGTGGLALTSPGAILISDPGNLLGITSLGPVSLTASNNISQAAGQRGVITASGAFTATAASSSGTPGIILTNTLNAVAGTVTLAAPGTIAFVNTVNTVIGRASGGSQGGLSAQLVDIEVLGAGNTLTLSNTGNVINGTTITLHANGNIVQGNTGGSIAGINLGLISDTGSIGSFTGSIALRGIGNLAARAPGDIYLNSVALAVNGATPITQITIGSVANLGPNGGTINGISSGGGNVGLAFGLFDVLGFDTIKANNLFISGNTIQLDNILVSSLAARTGGGDIDITSTGSFQINNSSVTTNPGITSTGAVYLTSGGAITQGSGTAGGITAGSLSVFGVTGVTLDNALNAVTGNIQLGSLGDALLVNALASHLNIGLAGGTFTLVSGGDLELVAGPSIATLASGESLTINNTNVLSALSLAQIGGIVISFRVDGDGIVLSTPGKFINNFGATALLAPGSRFLVYSADPANDVFGGLKTTGAGIFNASYPAAITAAGSRYIFSVASSTNTDFMTASTGTAGDTGNTGNTGTAGLTVNSNTAAAPALVGFVSAGQPPPRQPPPPPPPTRADALQISGALPPPPPPPPPRPNSPLADLFGPDSANSEPPSSSDQATSYVVGSLDGGSPPVVGGSGGGTVIPRYLTTRPNPPTGTLADATLLPAFGNTSLWQ